MKKIYFGDIIKQKRIERKKTQLELAQEIGVTRNYISDLERNRYKPSLKLFLKISKVLNLDANKLQNTIK